MSIWNRLGAGASIVVGSVVLAASVGAIVLAYNLSRDGFAAWPDPVSIPAAAGILGFGMVVAGVLSLVRSRRPRG